MGGKSDGQVVGYKYYFGLQMGVSRGPVDEMVEITVGDKVLWQGSITGNTTIDINKPELFGGEKKEGGIQGALDVMFGASDQVATSKLAEMLTGVMPGFRRTFTLFYDGMVCANSPYPKKWAVRARRTIEGWDGDVFRPDIAAIWMAPSVAETEHIESIKAMNPAHIIFECLTNREWGRGLPRAALDIPSFEAVAETLYAEGFGLCLRWTRTDEIQAFVQHVLDHIAGAIFMSRSSGLLTMRLVRGGYDASTLPLFDSESGLLEITEAAVSSSVVTTNEMIVQFREPVMNQDRKVRVTNLASLQSAGGAFNSIERSYPGLPTSDLARRVAQRDLRVSAEGLRRFSITVDRRGWTLEPGGLMRIRDASRHIPETVVRIGKIEDGTLQRGTIKLAVVQDVFAMPEGSFMGEQPGLWRPPVREACAGRSELFELPYFMLARNMRPADFAMLHDESAYFGTVVETGRSANVGYDLAVRSGWPTADDWPGNDDSFCGFERPEWAPVVGATLYRFSPAMPAGFSGTDPVTLFDGVGYSMNAMGGDGVSTPPIAGTMGDLASVAPGVYLIVYKVDDEGATLPAGDQPSWTCTEAAMVLPVWPDYAAMFPTAPEGSYLVVFVPAGGSVSASLEASDGHIEPAGIHFPPAPTIDANLGGNPGDFPTFSTPDATAVMHAGMLAGTAFSAFTARPIAPSETLVVRAESPVRDALFFTAQVPVTVAPSIAAGPFFEYGLDADFSGIPDTWFGADLAKVMSAQVAISLNADWYRSVGGVDAVGHMVDSTINVAPATNLYVRLRGVAGSGSVACGTVASSAWEMGLSVWNSRLSDIVTVPEADLTAYGLTPATFTLSAATYDRDVDGHNWHCVENVSGAVEQSTYSSAGSFTTFTDFGDDAWTTRAGFTGTWGAVATDTDWPGSGTQMIDALATISTHDPVSSAQETARGPVDVASPDDTVAGYCLASVTFDTEVTYTLNSYSGATPLSFPYTTAELLRQGALIAEGVSNDIVGLRGRGAWPSADSVYQVRGLIRVTPRADTTETP